MSKLKRRQLRSWLDSYMEYTRSSEAPDSFHRWIGMGCLASALQRKSYLRWGHETVYPNHYIVLVAPSGRARKSSALDIGRRLLETLGLPTLGDSNSQESIILDMRNSNTNYTDRSTGKIRFQSAVYHCANELSVFTKYQNDDLLAYLTDWYDCKDPWEYRTKHQGRDKIYGMCFNLIAATAPEWIPHIFTKAAMAGGLAQRMLFVYEERKRKIVANPNADPVNDYLESQLLHDLELISSLSGEMRLSADAQSMYEDWYESEEELINADQHPLSGILFEGYLSRRSTHLRKLGMALSASRGDDQIVSLADLRGGLDLLAGIEPKIPNVFRAMGETRYAKEMELVKDLIRRRGPIRKSELLQALSQHIDTVAFDVIIRTLISARLVRSVRDEEEGESVYQWMQRSAG